MLPFTRLSSNLRRCKSKKAENLLKNTLLWSNVSCSYKDVTIWDIGRTVLTDKSLGDLHSLCNNAFL